MIIHLICVGQKMPKWVQEAYQDYAKRLPKTCSLNLIELPMAVRGKTGSVVQYKQEEAKRILAALPKHVRLVALDEKGVQPSTLQLSDKLAEWLGGGQDVALIVGGPDGLDDVIRSQAHWLWSLSNLTLPHPLVRVVLAEQIYRAWSILQYHPYHRE